MEYDMSIKDLNDILCEISCNESEITTEQKKRVFGILDSIGIANDNICKEV